jgi:hypothetical protein
MNENEYDERLNKTEDTSELQLTPKGLYALILMKNFGIDIDDTRIDTGWEMFQQYIRKHFGEGDRVGGVVFENPNGVFYSFPTDDENFDNYDVDEE